MSSPTTKSRKFLKYKARVETQSDASYLFHEMSENGICVPKFAYEIKDINSLFLTVDFEAETDIRRLRNIISEMEDCHILLQTLNYASKYTGDRYYTIEKDQSE
jgi:hypothetical protein